MKIKYYDWRSKYSKNKETKVADISDFVAWSLTNSNGYDGQIERLSEEVRKTAGGVGRLVEVLTKKGLLDAQEIGYIAGGLDETIELIKENE